MIETYTPVPGSVLPTNPTPLKVPNPPRLYVLYMVFACMPFISIIMVSIWSEKAHQSLSLYVYLYLLAAVVTALLDYLAIAHIWKADSSEKETGLLLMAWCPQSSMAYQALMKLVSWKLNEGESPLRVAIGVFVGMSIIWGVITLCGVSVILRRHRLRELMRQRRIMIGI